MSAYNNCAPPCYTCYKKQNSPEALVNRFVGAGGYMSVNWITISLGNGLDSKVHWANIGPIWGRQEPGGPHVGPRILLSGGLPAKP